MNIGIIGPGEIAHRLAQSVSHMQGVSVVAVASRSLDKAREFARRHAIPGFYGDYAQMLREAPVELVYIATTHNFHYENILLCLAHGKHVLCEKCMVRTAEEAEAVRDHARQKKLFVMEAMWSRFLPTVNRAKRWIGEGRIGRLVSGSIRLGFRAPEAAENRFFNPQLAGGALFDIGVYAIEIATYIIGQRIVDARSILKYAETGVDVTDQILLEFPDCTIHLLTTILADVPQEAVFFGTEGYIVMPTPSYGDTCRLYDRTGRLLEEFVEDSKGLGTAVNGFIVQLEEVIRCIRAGRAESAVVPLEDTIECARIFDACLKQGSPRGEQG